MGLFPFLSKNKKPDALSEKETIKSIAPVLDGFWEIKFGTPKEEVKKIMESKPGCVFRDNNKDDQLMCLGLKFAGRDAFAIKFSFLNNKFHTANVYFEPSEPCEIIKLYNEIKTEINEKYFITNDDFEVYVFPFKKGDENFENAISSGNTNITSFWSFKNPNYDDDNLQNCISIYITKTLMVDLGYQDTILANEAVSELKEKNMKDY